MHIWDKSQCAQKAPPLFVVKGLLESTVQAPPQTRSFFTTRTKNMGWGWFDIAMLSNEKFFSLVNKEHELG